MGIANQSHLVSCYGGGLEVGCAIKAENVFILCNKMDNLAFTRHSKRNDIDAVYRSCLGFVN